MNVIPRRGSDQRDMDLENRENPASPGVERFVRSGPFGLV